MRRHADFIQNLYMTDIGNCSSLSRHSSKFSSVYINVLVPFYRGPFASISSFGSLYAQQTVNHTNDKEFATEPKDTLINDDDFARSLVK